MSKIRILDKDVLKVRYALGSVEKPFTVPKAEGYQDLLGNTFSIVNQKYVTVTEDKVV
jgi:hypothetical protein